MNAFISKIGLGILRHYRDPLSWSGIIVAVGAAAHFTVPVEYVQPIEAILASIVSILLLKADGRQNPNTDNGTGAVSVREPPVVVQADHVDVTAPAVVVPSKPAVGDVPTDTGHRTGFGKY